MSRSGGGRRERTDLDAIDRRIIELLRDNGRLGNRALAAATDSSEAGVAGRIRSMSAQRVLGITAIIDWEVAGYEWDVWLEVVAGGRALGDVGADLAALTGTHSVQTVFGPVDFIVHALLPKRSDAVAFIVDTVAAVPGVRTVRPNITLETLKYTVQYARVPVSARPLAFPAAEMGLDDLDRRIIGALTTDGRQSNREIARSLDVSEGTIRMRLRRMERAGLLRIVGQSDPYATGLVSAWAYTMVKVDGGHARAVAEQVALLPETTIVALIAGSNDIIVGLAAASRARLVDTVIEQMRAIAHVSATETWEVVHTIAFNYQWARLL